MTSVDQQPIDRQLQADKEVARACSSAVQNLAEVLECALWEKPSITAAQIQRAQEWLERAQDVLRVSYPREF